MTWKWPWESRRAPIPFPDPMLLERHADKEVCSRSSQIYVRAESDQKSNRRKQDPRNISQFIYKVRRTQERSGRKEYLAIIEIDQVIQSLWNLKTEEMHVCGKDYIKAGAGILEILRATPLQISMNNSKEEIRQGETFSTWHYLRV